jgi:uncharacterized protein YceK
MKSLIALVLVSSLLLAGCGAIVVRGALNQGSTVTASGVVSVVRLTFASDDKGGSITVTVVTLLQTGSAQDLTFCGSQVSQFPMDAFVTAKFTTGTTCSTLLTVTR